MNNVYEKGITSVRQLLKSITKFVDSSDVYPRGHGIYLDAVVLALVSKSIRVGDATCLLVENGFPDEAFGLSRTIMEIALSARHISNAESFSRSANFVKYYAKDHAEWTRLVAKYQPLAKPDFHPDHEKMLEIAKRFKDPHKWSGKTVRELALEEDTFELDPATGKPLNWEYDYEIVYKWTSHFVHGTVVSTDEHASGPSVPFRVRGGQQNIEKGGMALFNVALYVYRTLLAAFRSLSYEISKEIVDEVQLVLKNLISDADAHAHPDDTVTAS